MGRYWQIDPAGFIVNDAGLGKIDPSYCEAIAAAVSAYRSHLGPDAVGIYLRGTVARGMAVAGVSDLDSFALLASPNIDDELDWASREEARIVGDRALLTGVQFETYASSELDTDVASELLVIMATQSVCLFGEDLLTGLPGLKPDAAVANVDIVQIAPDIAEAATALEVEDILPASVEYWCRRIMKNFVRCGASLTMLDTGSFTRDLVPCARSFGRGYPSHIGDMSRVLEFALNPVGEPRAVLDMLDTFGRWMIDEADCWLDRNNPSRMPEMPI